MKHDQMSTTVSFVSISAFQKQNQLHFHFRKSTLNRNPDIDYVMTLLIRNKLFFKIKGLIFRPHSWRLDLRESKKKITELKRMNEGSNV